MAESLQVVDVTALTRPVRIRLTRSPLRRKRWHPVSVRCPDAVSSVFSEAAPALPAPQSQTSRPAGATVARSVAAWPRLQPELVIQNSNDDLPMTGSFHDRSTTTMFSRRLYDCADIVAEHIWGIHRSISGASCSRRRPLNRWARAARRDQSPSRNSGLRRHRNHHW